MEIRYPEIGICGLSCRLCPTYHAEGESKCGGCKSEYRIQAGCPFITCAVKKKGIEFCWQCDQNGTCEKWRGHREFSQKFDTFVCYQKLEDNITFVQRYGIASFEEMQKTRERLLREMLQNFNEGRSKKYYCISATVFEIQELKTAIEQARKVSDGLNIKERSKVLHTILNKIADKKQYCLSLRKQDTKAR